MKRRVVATALLALTVAACGGGSGAADLPPGPARTGAELFEARVLAGNAGCITCHSLNPGTELIGPSMAGVATVAATRIPGVDAASYLRKSITAPGSFLVEGFDDRMPANWEEELAPDELDALVAYLLTLEE